MKVGILGSGVVGQALADGFLKIGFEVMRGSREPEKLKKWQAENNSRSSVGTFEEAAQFGEIVVLALKGTAVESVVKTVAAKLQGKLVLDATNPIADKPPINGVLQFFTHANESLFERLQKSAPSAHFVKAFSCVGNAHFFQPKFAEKPSMFICGNDDQAKMQAREIIQKFGWEVEDMGAAESARAIEPLCMLWCLPGFRSNRWNHAFRLMHL